MLALTREKLVTHLQKTPSLVDMYQQRNPAFVEKTVTWLAELEQILLQVRSPLASHVAAERGRILAVFDGYRDGQISTKRVTRRKASLATTMLVLGQVDTSIQKVLDDIDGKFAIWREKMAQFIAVATNSHPIPLPPTEPRQAWLREVWRQFAVTNETQGMYNYLNTVMSRSDRLYILDELVGNLLSGQSDTNGT